MSTITDTPLVSVIVPIYNVEQYIDDCLNSIRQQTYTNLEIIIVEDCSTDNSDASIKPHLIDKRIKVIHHDKNSGLSAARNTGIDAAVGEFIMFVDSDDIINPKLIASCLKVMSRTNADVITYECTPFNDGQNYSKLSNLKANSSKKLEFSKIGNEYFNLPHFVWLKFIRTKVLKTNSISFPVGLYYEDWPFHWHLGLCTKNIYHIPVSFYLYRQRSTSITGSTGSKLLDLFKVHREVLKLVEHYKADSIKPLLVNKIKQSHWSILSRIDPEYLEVAFKEAKSMDMALSSINTLGELTLRNSLISLIIRQPVYTGLLTLIALRKTLKLRRHINR